MDIVLAADNNYVQHCAVTMTSILANNDDVRFYLLTEGIDQDNTRILNDLVISYKGLLSIIVVPSDIVKTLPMPSNASDHISAATYYRLFIPDYIPKEVERVIYMDCDIVVRKSLLPLWNTDIKEFALGAAYQGNEWSDSYNSWERLKLPREYGYFNAGVLLINLKYWREHNVQKCLFDFIAQNANSIVSHDQDVLNAVLYKNTIPLSYTWNFLPFFFDYYGNLSFRKGVEDFDTIESIKKDPAVIHYVYKPKPWQCGCRNPYRKDYYKYLERTPWNGFRPQFSLKSYWHNFIKESMVHNLSKLKHQMFGK